MNFNLGQRLQLSCPICGKPITEGQHHVDQDDILDIEVHSTTAPYNEKALELSEQCPKCGKWGRPSLWKLHQEDDPDDPAHEDDELQNFEDHLRRD